MSNDALRAHLTRIGFDLSLAKSHVAALVFLNEVGARRWDFAAVNAPRLRVSGYGRAHSNFGLGSRGLQERGLITHDWSEGEDLQRHTQDADGTWHLYSKRWTITKAGRLVVDLLKEAGIYQDFARDLIFPYDQKAAIKTATKSA